MLSSARTATREHGRLRALTLAVAGAGLLLIMLLHATHARASDDETSLVVSPACGFSDDAFDNTTDIHAIDLYEDAIALLLQRQKFAELDCIADHLQTTKARFSGGSWKLRSLYLGLRQPRPGHPTQEDWRHHMALMEQWIQLRPHSVTAQIALAESYADFGWDARGNGDADSVTESGWKLFGQRMEKARQILDAAKAPKPKSPEWYAAMQDVAEGQSWDLPKRTALLQEAVAFEPGYQYYYRGHAYLLLPRWGGEEGESERFTAQAADKVGGEDGDILYFQIATRVICACDDPAYTYFSWPRLQKGFAATEKKYGPDLVNTNSVAMMAVKWHDWAVAAPELEKIGDQWSKSVWLTEQYFRSTQAMAKGSRAAIDRSHIIQQEAEANGATPEGIAYHKDFDYRWAAIEQPCTEKAKEDATEFDFYVNVGKDGGVDDAWGTHPTPMMQCLMKAFYDTHVKNEKPFPAPPKAPYWVSIHVDPSKTSSAMK